MNRFIKIFTLSFLVFRLIFISNNALSTLPPSEKDSLLSIWNNPKEEDSTRMNALRRYAWHGYLFSQPDSAFYFAQLHFDFAKEKKDSLQMSTALNVQATALNFQGDFNSAIEYYNRSLAINEARNDQKGIASILNNIGNIYRKQGNFPKATDCFFRSLQIKEQENDVRGVAISLGSLGVLFMEQKQYDEAIDYFNRCITYLEKFDNKMAIAGTLNNLGLIYADQGGLEKAIDIHNQSLRIREEANNQRGIAESLNNLGMINLELGKYTIAIDYFEQSLSISQESKDLDGEALALYNLGRVYAKEGQYIKAIDFGNKSLKLATEIGKIILKKDAYKLLYESNKALNRPNLALEMYEKHIQLRDSIYKEENKEELMRQKFQYDYEKQKALLIADQVKKDAIAEKKLLEKQQKQNIIIILFVVCIIVIVGISWFIYKQRQAKYKYVIAQSELKVLRSQLKPHFVFNVLNSINTYILNEDSQSASRFLLSFSKVMRSALESMSQDMNNLQEEIDLLQKIVDLESLRLRKKINLVLNDDEDWAEYIIPAMILQPIIENAIVHGVENSPNDIEEISMQINTDNDLLSILVQNRHHGKFKEDSKNEDKKEKRFGFSITQERIKLMNEKYKIKGDLDIRFNEHYTEVRLTLPLIVD
jgi:tetratricopeptide (TPR) repeat protein